RVAQLLFFNPTHKSRVIQIVFAEVRIGVVAFRLPRVKGKRLARLPVAQFNENLLTIGRLTIQDSFPENQETVFKFVYLFYVMRKPIIRIRISVYLSHGVRKGKTLV